MVGNCFCRECALLVPKKVEKTKSAVVQPWPVTGVGFSWWLLLLCSWSRNSAAGARRGVCSAPGQLQGGFLASLCKNLTL